MLYIIIILNLDSAYTCTNYTYMYIHKMMYTKSPHTAEQYIGEKHTHTHTHTHTKHILRTQY